jgi:hypothetical protein
VPAAKGNRHAAGRGTKTALQRFAEKCEFDPATGCVLWTGGTTAGQGNSARYGAFWDAGPWKAHRWAAIHIHGFALGADQAGHCCPAGPNTLCVQHLTGQTITENVIERNERVARERRQKCLQDSMTRQAWLFVQLGINGEPEPESTNQNLEPRLADIPFHEPPEWFRPYMRPPEANDDDCPF